MKLEGSWWDELLKDSLGESPEAVPEPAIQTVLYQEWYESERGWGIRPDGFSLHLTVADRTTFISKYYESMPETAPNEYSAPKGEPIEVEYPTRPRAPSTGPPWKYP